MKADPASVSVRRGASALLKLSPLGPGWDTVVRLAEVVSENVVEPGARKVVVSEFALRPGGRKTVVSEISLQPGARKAVVSLGQKLSLLDKKLSL